MQMYGRNIPVMTKTYVIEYEQNDRLPQIVPKNKSVDGKNNHHAGIAYMMNADYF